MSHGYLHAVVAVISKMQSHLNICRIHSFFSCHNAFSQSRNTKNAISASCGSAQFSVFSYPRLEKLHLKSDNPGLDI